MRVASQRPEGWTLDRLLEGFTAGVSAVSPPVVPAVSVEGLSLDSRRLQPGFLFLACGGGEAHGLDFAQQAVEAGSVAIAFEPDRRWDLERVRASAAGWGVPVIAIPGLQSKVGPIAARYFGHPSRALTVVGITGTNGKTSCTHYLAQALDADMPCGVIGTLGMGLYGALTPSEHTTPDAIAIQATLAGLRDQGAGCVAMEVSSHGLTQGRVQGVAFDVAVLTNLSRDHLDYHGDMENYARVKKALFRMPELRCAVINADDPVGLELLNEPLSVRDTRVYGLHESISHLGADYIRGIDLQATARGIALHVESSWGTGLLESVLLGRFNARNLLAVLSVLLWLGVPFATAMRRLTRVCAVPGRMQRFGGAGKPVVIVDYAHTPDALEHVLWALRAHCVGRLWCVFGCGGERDRGKRPLMGEIAARYSDRVVVSDDNPRRESGEQIVRDILAGIAASDRVSVVRERRSAIRFTLAEAAAEDVVLVAGKGHEGYQQVGDLKLPFSDSAVVEQALANRASR